MFFGGPGFFLALLAIAFVMWAQFKVKSTYAKYDEVIARSGVTGAQVARDILDKHGLTDVPVEYVPGQLSDHYDPKKKVVRLSDSTYNSRSIAALGVAAHEVGHAIQHDVAYVPLHMRNMIFPVARIGDMFGPWIAIIGLIISGGPSIIVDFGILLFAMAVLFYVVTLPVEFNASSRAVEILETGGYLTREEVVGTKKVLNAAALTYVAAAASAVITLLRLLMMRGRD